MHYMIVMQSTRNINLFNGSYWENKMRLKDRIDNMEVPNRDWEKEIASQIPAGLRLWTKLGHTSIRRKYLCPMTLQTEGIDPVTQDRLELTILLGDAYEERIYPVIESEIRKYGFTEDVTEVASRALTLIGRVNIEERCFADLNDSTLAAKCQVMHDLRLSDNWKTFVSKLVIFKSTDYYHLHPAVSLDPRCTLDPRDRHDTAQRKSINDIIDKFLFIDNRDLESLSAKRARARNDKDIERIQWSLPIDASLERVKNASRIVSGHHNIRNVEIPPYDEPRLQVHRKKFKVIHNYSYGFYENTGGNFLSLLVAWLSGLAKTENRIIWLRADPVRIIDDRLSLCSEIAFELAKIIEPLQAEYLSRRLDIDATPQASECSKALLKLSVATLEDVIGYTLYSDQSITEKVLARVCNAIKIAKSKLEDDDENLNFSGIQANKWLKLKSTLINVADSRQLINLTFDFFPSIKVDWRYTELINAIFQCTTDIFLNGNLDHDNTETLKLHLDSSENLQPIDVKRIAEINQNVEGKLEVGNKK